MSTFLSLVLVFFSFYGIGHCIMSVAKKIKKYFSSKNKASANVEEVKKNASSNEQSIGL